MSPYSRERYGTRKQYEKYLRCVEKVKKKNKRVKSPQAVCRAAVYGKKKKSHRGKKRVSFMAKGKKVSFWAKK